MIKPDITHKEIFKYFWKIESGEYIGKAIESSCVSNTTWLKPVGYDEKGYYYFDQNSFCIKSWFKNREHCLIPPE